MKKHIQNIFLFFISSITILATIELLCIRVINSKLEKLDYNEKIYNFYELHYKELHHLSVHPQKFKNIDNINSLIFRTLGRGEKTVLIHGDSWGTQFERKDFQPKLINFSEKHNIKFILAGNTSYSFSPLTAQLTKLRNVFGINPDFIIVAIDQSDIGDELIRYKDLRRKEEGSIIVLPDPIGIVKTYSVGNHIEKCKILTSNNFSLKKLILYQKFNLELNKQASYKNEGASILQFLQDGINDEQDKYISEVIDDYFSNVFSSKRLKRLFIITHPHKKHLTKDYKLNINDLIISNILESKHKDSIHLIDDFNISIEDDLDQIFVHNDSFSHLNDQYFENVYLKKVLENINSYFY